MGLSSSQGRLLMLTSRLSDIELQEIVISQRQNKLAIERETETKDYMEATTNYKLVINVKDSSASGGYSSQDLNYSNMTQMGYLLSNANEQIYLQKDENGDWIIPNDLDGNPLCTIDQTTGKATVKDKEFGILDGSDYLNNSSVLQNSIMNGTLFVINVNDKGNTVSKDLLESDTQMQYVPDTSDDAEAESKHEYETARLERQENQLEMDMQQLETQHEAILKEYDSVKEVISNNVERTFKLFSNG